MLISAKKNPIDDHLLFDVITPVGNNLGDGSLEQVGNA